MSHNSTLKLHCRCYCFGPKNSSSYFRWVGFLHLWSTWHGLGFCFPVQFLEQKTLHSSCPTLPTIKEWIKLRSSKPLLSSGLSFPSRQSSVLLSTGSLPSPHHLAEKAASSKHRLKLISSSWIHKAHFDWQMLISQVNQMIPSATATFVSHQ